MQLRDWSNDLSDCCNEAGECALSYFCTPCYLCVLFSRAKEPCCSCLFGGILALRTKVRVERGIKGSIVTDYCNLFWCYHCALIQIGMILICIKLNFFKWLYKYTLCKTHTQRFGIEGYRTAHDIYAVMKEERTLTNKKNKLYLNKREDLFK